ncbi:TRAP transporter substrate-binding protein DctP [Ruicaihuangia caeni]|uniref:TRAP transporter substrate-binding protein DctP n=1 Tax=Ruicaihuangia caeni TaxID=3042517 RepID=UPI00338EE80D
MRTHRTLAAIGGLVAATAMLAGCTSGAGNGDANGDNGSTGETVNLQLATYLGPAAPPAVAIQWAADELKERSNGEINIEIFFAEALLKGPDVIPGVAQNRADMGVATMSYNPGELPLTQAISVPFQNSDPAALTAAIDELFDNNEDFKAEWERTQTKQLSFIGGPTGIVSSSEEITGVDWFKGKNVRATSYTANALQAVGANPVGITLGEIYEGMERGTIDGYASMLMDTITSASLQEVSPFVVDTGIGTYAGNVVVINPTVWDGLSDEHKSLFEEVFAEFQDEYLSIFSGIEDETCDALIAEGGGTSVWPASETDKWKSAVGDSVLNDWKQKSASAGVGADAVDAFWEQYQDALEANQSADSKNGMERCAER